MLIQLDIRTPQLISTARITAAVAAGGGVVLFPPGSYLVTGASLNLVSDVVFWGYGAKLTGDLSGTTSLMSYVNTAEGGTGIVNSMILGLTIDTTTMAGSGIQIESQNCVNITIRDVTFEGSSSAEAPALRVGYLNSSSFCQ